MGVMKMWLRLFFVGRLCLTFHRKCCSDENLFLNFQCPRPITLKKDNIQTRNRKMNKNKTMGSSLERQQQQPEGDDVIISPSTSPSTATDATTTLTSGPAAVAAAAAAATAAAAAAAWLQHQQFPVSHHFNHLQQQQQQMNGYDDETANSTFGCGDA